MRNFLLFVFISFSQSFYSQNNANLSSGDGKAFRVILQGKALNETPQAHVVLENILKDTLRFELEFENKKKLPATIYFLEKGEPCKNKEFNYRVSLDNNTLGFYFLGVFDIRPLPNPLVPKTPIIDTSLKYNNKVLEHFCELKESKAIYFNNIPQEGNCKIPMPKEYLNYTALLISKAPTYEYKYRIVENVCGNNCISVDQLNVLLKYIDYEIDKLKIVRFAYPHLTDPSNQKNLEKSFGIEASVSELNAFLKTPVSNTPLNKNNCATAASQMLLDSYSAKLKALPNDAERFETLKKGYSDLCYSQEQVGQILGTFIHDREKLEAAKLLYPYCIEKEKYTRLSYVFSYDQSGLELKDFVEKQKK